MNPYIEEESDEENFYVRGKKNRYKFRKPKNYKNPFKKADLLLQELFPMIEKSVIMIILDQAKGDFEKAFENLLEIHPDSEVKAPEVISEQKDVANLHEPTNNIEEVKKKKEQEETKGEPMADIEEQVIDKESRDELIHEIAMDFIDQHPKFPIDKVKELLNKYDLDILKLKDELIKERVKGPLSEKELIRQNKEAILDYYLDGQEPTKEFLEFYYSNDLQEQEMNKVMSNQEESKEESKEEAKEEAKGLSCSDEEVFYYFPSLDNLIVNYVLSFYSPAKTIEYLKKLYPDKFVANPKLPEARGHHKKFRNRRKMRHLKNASKNVNEFRHPRNRFVYIDGKDALKY